MKKELLDFWKRIDDKRSERNMTLAELANAVGLNESVFKNQRFRDRVPYMEDCVRIAEALHVSLDWLCCGKNLWQDKGKLEKLVKAYENADTKVKIAIDVILDI